MNAHPSKPNIRDLSKQDLENWFIEQGEQKFRAVQVWEWLWQKSARTFDAMSNLSKSLREKLQQNYSLPAVSIDTFQVSKDRTIKMRLDYLTEIL